MCACLCVYYERVCATALSCTGGVILRIDYLLVTLLSFSYRIETVHFVLG